MNRLLSLPLLCLIVALTVGLQNCKKPAADPVKPTTTTPPTSSTSPPTSVTTATTTVPTVNTTTVPTVSGITTTSATVSAVLDGNGGAPISQHGFVYSKTNQTPTLTDSKTERGATTGPFPLTISSNLTGLEANTTYYVRVYATNEKGTGYGAVGQVKTDPQTIASSGNFLYYGTEKGLAAMDAATGTIAWQNTTLGYTRYAPFIVGDKVVVGSGTSVWGLDTKTGATRWEFKTGGAYLNLTVKNGIAYATTDGNSMVYAIDANSGTQKWAYKAEGGIQQQPTVDKDVVIASSYGTDAALFALDINTGTLKWRRKGGGSIALRQTMATDGNLIAAASTSDSSLVCLESLTGKPKWNFGRIGYYDHPTIVGGVAYINQFLDLSAINVATGKLVWKYTSPSAAFVPSTSFVIGNGLAYAIDGGGILYALDVANGSRKWSYPAVNRDASPTLAGEVLYVLGAITSSSSPSKELFVLNSTTGALRTTISVTAAPPTTRITALINGKAYYPGAFSMYQ